MKKQILTCSIFLIYLLIHPHLTTAQVTVTQATGGTNICIDNPIATPISNIVISENSTSDIKTIAGGTFVLTLTSGFEWAGTPTVATTGSDLSGATVTITGTGNTALTVTFNCTNTVTSDIITLSNLKIFAVSPPPDGQAIIITRSNNASGGNAIITGSINADYGVISSRVAPNSFITGLASSYCSNSNPVLLSAIPSISGSSFSFTSKVISGPGTITANTINFSGGNYFFDPSTIAGINSITGTAIQILFSSTLPGGCVTTAIGITSVSGLPAVDFTLPTDGVTPGNMRQSDVTFNLIGTPSGGTFSGNGVTGNVFDTRIVPTYQSIPVTYTASLNGCTNSITKNITVVTATGIVLLNARYCNADSPVNNISINGSNLPQPFQTGVYELITIIGDGITGYVSGGGTVPNFTFTPSSVNNLNVIQKVKVRTQKKITTANISGYYWNAISGVNTCLDYSGIIFSYLSYQTVSLPYTFSTTYQLNNNFNYPGPNYYCVGPFGGGAFIYTYDYKGISLGTLTGTFFPYWEIQPDIEQNIIISSAPVVPGVNVPSDSNCVNNSLQTYQANNTDPGATIRWWANSATPVANAPAGAYLFQGTSVNASTGLGASNSSAASIQFKITQEKNGCLSGVGTFKVNIYNNPSHPNLVSPINSGSSTVNYSICQYTNSPTLSVAGLSMSSFKWYNSSTFSSTYDIGSQNSLTPNSLQLNTSITGNTDFYATQIVNGCETPTPGLKVTISVLTTPSVPTLNSKFFDICNGSSFPTITATAAVGGNTLNWYGDNSTTSGIDFIFNKPGITSSVNDADISNPAYFNYNSSITGSSFTYNVYVSQVQNGCESSKSKASINIASIPEPPTLNYTSTYCNGTNPDPVTVPGLATIRTINFYNTDSTTIISTSGANLFYFPSTIIGQTGTFNYYFTQKRGVCTSPKAKVTVNLSTPIPPPPLSPGTNAINPYCEGDIINNFGASPTNFFYGIKWKNSTNSVLGISSSLLITFTGTTSGINYEAYQFDIFSGCESSTFTGAQLVVYAKPPIPGVIPANYFCSQTTPQPFLLNASTVSGNLLTWYTDINLTSIVGTGNNLNSGVDLSDRNTPIDDFYVTQTAFYTNPTKNCASDAVKLNVSVYPTPKPVITRFAEVGTRFGLEDTLCTNDIKSNLPLQNLVFPQGGIFYINGVLSTDFNINPTPGLKRVRYFYTQTHGGINCPSDTSRYIRVLPLPVINFIYGKLCVGDTVNLISTTTVAGTDQISKYKWNVGSATRFSPDTLASVKIVFLNPSIYDMSLKIDTKDGCSDTKLFQPNVQPYPKLNFTSRNVCLTDTTILESKLMLKDIFGNLNYYKDLSFYFGDGDSIRFDPINTNGIGGVASRTFGNAQKIRHIYLQPGVYSQKIIASTTNGCDTSDVARFFILPKIHVTPGNDYVQNFENPDHGFVTSDSITSWQVGTPNKTVFTNAASGSKAWVTNLNGSYARNENTSVRCPCFDYSAINKPMISMTIRTNLPPNNVDGVVLQANDGLDNNWATVGNITSSDARDAGVNWYNAAAIVGNPGAQSLGQVGWSSDSSKSWRIARFKLDSLKDISQTRNLNTKSIRFRVAFGTSSSTVVSTNFNGFAFDDFSVLERDKILLVEHFTNTTGKTSKTDDQYIDDLTNLNRNDMVAIHYHTAFPGTDDFNTLNIADPSAKALFYGVDQVPYSVLSGNKYNGNTQGLRQNLIDTAFLQKAKFALTIDTPFAAGGNAYSLKIKATAVSSVSDPTALYVALVERTVAGSNVTAANGQTNFEWVMRKLVPDAAGTSISDVWSPSTVKDFIFSTSLDKVHDATQVGVIAFIQNKITKEVYQSAYVGPKAVIQSSGLQSTVTSIENRLDPELISLYPNPGNDLVHILNNNAIAKDLHWIMYDQLGKLVKTGVLLSGIQLSEINTSLFPAGVYIIGFSDNINATIYKKVVLIK